jgi:putative SOS response-associated peptidase YedK
MCNSYEALSNYQEYVEAFSDTLLPLKFPPASAAPNLPDQPLVRPTDIAPVIREREGASELVRIRWGFAPFKPKAGPIINYRSDGRNFRSGRCLAPASAFFEYTGDKYPKTRWRVSMSGERWFAIAGVIRTAQDDWPESFSLLTCPPGADIAPYHDRQMVVLRRDDFARWLDPQTGERELVALMQPAPEGSLAIAKT